MDSTAKLLLTAAKNHVIVWDFEKGTELRRIPMYQEFDGVTALNIRPDEPVVQLITGNGFYAEWDIRTGDRVRIGNLTSGQRIDAAAIAPGGNIAAIALDNQGTLDLVDLATGEFWIRFHNLHQDRQWFTETAYGHIDGPPEILNLEQLVLAEQKLQYDSDAVRTQCLAMRQRTAKGTVKTHSGTSTGRRLFVLAVGGSEHRYSEYNLRYAHLDAEVLAQHLQTMPNRAFREVFAQIYSNREATADHIREGLDWLVRSCGPEDVAIILFSGHGVRGRNGLYFVPYEGDAESIQATCLNWSEAAGRVAQTTAAQILFFADCCHAGAFSTENRPTQDDIVRAFERKQNVLLFCSSTGEQKSVEQEAVRQGVFTAGIIDAFHGKADADGDQTVTAKELVEYVTQYVGRQTNSEQTPHVPYPEQYDRSFEVVRLH
ncbi:MAG: caspase family protein [Planctomycetaceae bacterium]|nr:caspase family protein [Planctomycetaceae bacterium]